ncbi:MAG: hypothetical protein WC346_04395 [Methanogenium sp.]|jgi:hypothetical protein
MNKELIETQNKIQSGKTVSSEELNRLWNYYRVQENKLLFVRFWNNGFKYKFSWFSWRVLE